MKREKLALFCASALTLSLTACGAPAQVPAEQSSETTLVTTQPAQETAAETEAQKETAFDQAPTIEETVLYDLNGLKITALSLTYEEENAVLTIRLENTGDRDYFLSLNEYGSSLLSVNGRYVPLYLDYLSVFLEETMEYDILLSYDLLEEYGISAISEISMCLTEKDFSTGILTVSTGAKSQSFLKTLRNNPENPPILESAESFFEAEDVKHVATVAAEDAWGHRCLYLDFQNTGEEIRLLRMSEETLNGLHLLPKGDMISLMPGEHGQLVLDLTGWEQENHLEELGIQNVGTLQFHLSVLEQDTTILQKPSAVTMKLDDKIPDWQETGRVISPEGEQKLYFVDAVPLKDGKTDFTFVWVNDSGQRFVSQVQSLCYGEKEIPISKQSISLYGKGKAVLIISADLKSAGMEEPFSGSFTLNTYQRIGGSGERVSFDFTIQ